MKKFTHFFVTTLFLSTIHINCMIPEKDIKKERTRLAIEYNDINYFLKNPNQFNPYQAKYDLTKKVLNSIDSTNKKEKMIAKIYQYNPRLVIYHIEKEIKQLSRFHLFSGFSKPKYQKVGPLLCSDIYFRQNLYFIDDFIDAIFNNTKIKKDKLFSLLQNTKRKLNPLFEKLFSFYSKKKVIFSNWDSNYLGQKRKFDFDYLPENCSTQLAVNVLKFVKKEKDIDFYLDRIFTQKISEKQIENTFNKLVRKKTINRDFLVKLKLSLIKKFTPKKALPKPSVVKKDSNNSKDSENKPTQKEQIIDLSESDSLTLKCHICMEPKEKIIPMLKICNNEHNDEYICKACYEMVQKESNTCPLCRASLKK